MNAFPNVAAAFGRFGQDIQLEVAVATPVNGQVTKTVMERVIIQGSLQPMPPQKVNLKPEGEREWMWWTLWTRKKLDAGQTLKDMENRTFRVMNVQDWGVHFVCELTETSAGL